MTDHDKPSADEREEIMKETGYWLTVKGEDPLSPNVYAIVSVTIFADGTIACQTRSAEGRDPHQVARDVGRARDRLTTQLEERFTRCPVFKTQEIA